IEAQDAFDARSISLRRERQAALGLANDRPAFDRIITGQFDGKGGPTQPYFNLARWIKQELERLNHNATKFVGAHATRVTVQAFLSPLGGSRRAVHVEGYDNIPAGDLQPIDRTGLRMTPAERARLAMEIDMAQKAVDAIQEIRKSADQLGRDTNELFSQLKTRLIALEDALTQRWWTKLGDGSLLQPLQALVENPATPEARRDAARAILAKLQEFKQDHDSVAVLVLRIKVVRNAITSGTVNDLHALVVAGTSLLPDVSALVGQLSALNQKVETWPARIAAVVDGLKALAGIVAADEIVALTPPEVTRFVTDLKTQLAGTLKFVADVRAILNDGGLAEGAATLASTNVDPIWRDQANLVPGKLELSRVGLAQADEITINVTSRLKAPEGTAEPLATVHNYKVQAVLMGLHRKYGASAVFARGTGETPGEKQWKPSVAAHVHWYYRQRQPSGGWRAWNGFNPGLGLHAATLNHGTESVEFGVGANLSLFDGILTVGYGANLSNQQRRYYSLGLSLFDTLDHVKSLQARSRR
ncbi:MAG: hypothetical protein HY736_13400, partial [Verrucomicrobia bacterium]|nr:hypothetical protein [Verrucomicrobiota bacterium]